MRVWIVWQSVDYEGGTLEGIFTDEEKARKMLDELNKDERLYKYQIKEIETDTPIWIGFG